MFPYKISKIDKVSILIKIEIQISTNESEKGTSLQTYQTLKIKGIINNSVTLKIRHNLNKIAIPQNIEITKLKRKNRNY